jgi:tripartite-type tricarboxylate transporter receptor subunit TctC
MKSKILFMVAVVSLVLLSPQIGATQGYPTKPVEIVIGFTAGTTFDIMTRLVADLGGKYLGQPMIVTNKTGAAGTIAAADVVASKPDGYKIFMHALDFFSGVVYTQKIPFDPNDLVPLANFMGVKMGLAVRGDSPIKNFSDFLSYVRKNPGQLKWAHQGRGTPPHLTVLAVLKKEGLTAIDVPFKGAVEGVTALLGGHVDALTVIYGNIADLVKAGKLRFIVLYDEKRFKDFPEVPTLIELGYPEAVIPGVAGFYIHKNTPQDIQKKLLDVCKKVYDEPEFKKGLEKLNVEPLWGDPEFLRKKIEETKKWQIPLLKELGMYVGK